MITAIYGALESGLIYALMALGVYLSFRILDFPDLTVDGSFVTGGAVSAIMIVQGSSPLLATLCGGIAGFFAGCITGLLHTKGKINSLLAGILMMTALYSINLRIMDKPNIPLFGADSIFNAFFATEQLNAWLQLPFNWLGLSEYTPSSFNIIVIMIIVVIILKKVVDWLLATEIGLALRATGDNDRMIKSLSANTDHYIIFGLGLSNGLVAASGALYVQYNGFADVNLGIGMIIVGLASVIIGEALIGDSTIRRATLAVIAGAIIYRLIIALALRIEFLKASDMKLITAIIVIFALVFPTSLNRFKQWRNRVFTRKKIEGEGGHSNATTK